MNIIMRVKGNKANITITLPPELVTKARDLGLNISRVCENALKNQIERLEEPKHDTGRKYTFLNQAPANKD